MKELAAMFVAAGCSDVVTYIQSGNVVFDASPAAAKKLPAAIEAVIAKRFGMRVPVVMRTAAELSAAARDNPFLAAGADPDELHLAFLAEAPSATQIASLDPKRSPPDAFVVRGANIYLHLPGGVAKTKLSNAYFDAKLGTTSTVRNWRTVLKLVELAA
jgi:uncharacterized protein (DUF1697 family)